MFADAAGWNRPIWFAGGAGGHACVRDTAVEPIAWAEELIEPARAVDHPRLAVLYMMAAQCWMAGRIEAAARYSDAGQTGLGSGRDDVPFGTESWFGGAYVAIGRPQRWVEFCRAQLVCGRDTHAFARASLVLASTFADSGEEAMAAANGLIDAAEATHNPRALSLALLAYGVCFCDADPVGALAAFRRGLARWARSPSRSWSV